MQTHSVCFLQYTFLSSKSKADSGNNSEACAPVSHYHQKIPYYARSAPENQKHRRNRRYGGERVRKRQKRQKSSGGFFTAAGKIRNTASDQEGCKNSRKRLAAGRGSLRKLIFPMGRSQENSGGSLIKTEIITGGTAFPERIVLIAGIGGGKNFAGLIGNPDSDFVPGGKGTEKTVRLHMYKFPVRHADNIPMSYPPEQGCF